MDERPTHNQFFQWYRWMVDELGLKGNELLVYAVIWSYSRNNGCYFGSQQTLMRYCGISSKDTCNNVLKKLVNDHLISKEVIPNANGTTSCKYKALRVD